MNNDPSTFDNSGEHNILKLYYPHDQEAFAINSRAYIDAYSNNALYSHHVTPYQAAYRHLKEMKTCVKRFVSVEETSYFDQPVNYC